VAPPTFIAELNRWLSSGVWPRDQLLQAILQNDLAHAVAIAGPANEWQLVHLAMVWLWNHAPVGSYGSPERCRAWQDAVLHHAEPWGRT
jgi:hypothetical protein